jgi:hypothetical protein
MFPLFAETLIAKKLSTFVFPEDLLDRRQVISKWQGLFTDKLEAELQPNIHEFLHDLFVDVLGYGSPFGDETWELELVPQASLGLFGEGLCHPLVKIDWDASYPAENNHAYEWIVRINSMGIYLLHGQMPSIFCEQFLWSNVTELFNWQKFYLLLCRRTLLPRSLGAKSHTLLLFEESQELENEYLRQIYTQVVNTRDRLTKDFRHRLSQAEVPDQPTVENLADEKALKLIYRILFITYAQSWQLLPPRLIGDAYDFYNPYQEQPVWCNYKAIFHGLRSGNSRFKELLPTYVCSIFAPDLILDEMIFVGDELCRQLKEIAKFNVRENLTLGAWNCLLHSLLPPPRKRPAKYPCKYLGTAQSVIAKLQVHPNLDVNNLIIFDRQCRSGTLLVVAFFYLLQHTNSTAEFIMTNCLYGTDPDPQAVAMTKLNLWLAGLTHCAPVTALDQHIYHQPEVTNQFLWQDDHKLVIELQK